MTGGATFRYAGSSLSIDADLVPWDSMVVGSNVAQIIFFSIENIRDSARDYEVFLTWRDALEIQIVSCRLDSHQLKESMFLESKDFRFIEMVMHPKLDRLQELNIPDDKLTILPAVEDDLNVLQQISEESFVHERYHADPRIENHLADKRYGNWVINSYSHPQQQLLKILLDDQVIGFFIVELGKDRSVFWHLTAIAKQWQGRGLGKRVWSAMLRRHQEEGLDSVATRITASNIVVQNLYARLGFRFLSPKMTLHWMREGG